MLSLRSIRRTFGMTKVALGFLAMATIARCHQGEEEGGILSKQGEEVEADSTAT